ncbi:MAG: glutamate--tRNA ligase [Actinomycetota bacterium]
MSVRVRFAPAPSGSLHVGNARAALYNWLFARQQGGVFVLRIEDTDQSRVTEEAFQAVLEDLAWLGLDWDEGPGVGGPYGPYRQSERLERYREAAERLLAAGVAYPCYCTSEELAARRRAALAAGRRPGYDRRCYHLTEAEKEAFESGGRPFALRFHVPAGSTTFRDLVTGDVTVEHDQIDDFVIVRQDGFPLYNLAATVDDGAMGITHVIRGLDIQSATPRQILLHRQLGNPIPAYAHLPLILGADRQPLSKRHGVVSVAWYREHGFLPEAMVNYLAFLGWGLGEEAILSRQELLAHFRLQDVNASPSMFDLKKMDWMNGEHIRALEDDDLEARLAPWLVSAGLTSDPPSQEETALIAAVAPLVKTRIERWEQAGALVRAIFTDVEMDPAAMEKVMREPYVAELLRRAEDSLRLLEPWTRDSIETALRAIQSEMGLKPKRAFVPFYVAITGQAVAAPIFDSMVLIGRQKCLQRLARAREVLV